MVNRAKYRFIAFATFTAALFLFVLSLIVTQANHSDSNWYITVKPGDRDHSFVLLPNIPYAIESDNWISRIAFSRKNRFGYDRQIYYQEYTKPGDGHGYYFTQREFHIVSNDTVTLTLGVHLSGFLIKDAYYEVHKDKVVGIRFNFTVEDSLRLE